MTDNDEEKITLEEAVSQAKPVKEVPYQTGMFSELVKSMAGNADENH